MGSPLSPTLLRCYHVDKDARPNQAFELDPRGGLLTKHLPATASSSQAGRPRPQSSLPPCDLDMSVQSSHLGRSAATYQRVGRFFVAHGRSALRGPDQTLLTHDPATGWAQPMDLYHPPGPARGTIMSVHGMSLLGCRDPRIIRLHRAFAEAGFLVVAPDFPSIRDLRIHAEQPLEVVRAMRALRAASWCTHPDALRVFSVSFSSALALRAAAHPDVAAAISSLCIMGGFATMEEVVAWLLCDPQADPYGRQLVLANTLELLGPSHEAAGPLLLAHAKANFLKLPVCLEGPAWSTATPDTREIVRALHEDPDYRVRCWQELHPRLRPLYDAFDPVRHLHEVRADLVLIHGENDPVIPPSQSLTLADAARRIGIRVHVVVTPLLSHGDPAPPSRMLRHVPALAGAFGRFFA